MPLTAEQKAKIKDILKKYRHDVNGVVKKHKQDVVHFVEEADKQQAEKIRQALAR
jgi:Spy/CpxP family protein refolding chaperone